METNKAIESTAQKSVEAVIKRVLRNKLEPELRIIFERVHNEVIEDVSKHFQMIFTEKDGGITAEINLNKQLN